AGVIDEVSQCVVARVDGPDNFVERGDRLARGGGHFFDAFVGLFLFRKVAEHGDEVQAGAEIIVDVARDAGAFAFDGVLPFELLHSPAETTQADVANGQGNQG